MKPEPHPAEVALAKQDAEHSGWTFGRVVSIDRDALGSDVVIEFTATDREGKERTGVVSYDGSAGRLQW